MPLRETEDLIDTQDKGKTILLLGWSGLTGSYVMEKLLTEKGCKQLILWGRKIPENPHNKVKAFKGKPQELTSELQNVDVVICCLGTTIKTAGSKENFKAVDYQLPLTFAKMVKKSGVEHFCLMSAVGANKESSNFYISTKGALENDIQALNFRRFDIFRPSLLLGPRKEFRLGEKLSQWIFPLLKPLLLGKLSIYKPIHSEKVAQAMVHSSLVKNLPGVFIHHYKEMIALIKQ